MGFRDGDEVGFPPGTVDIVGWHDDETGQILPPSISRAQLPRGGQGFRPITMVRPRLAATVPGHPPAYPGGGASMPVIGMPGHTVAYQVATAQREAIARREPLPLGFVLLAALGGTGSITVKPQKPWRVERLSLATDSADALSGVFLTGFTVGTSNQFVSTGAIAVELFRSDAIDVSFRGDTATSGVDVTLTFSNSNALPVRVAGLIQGTALDQ